jgi:3-methyladenine DNA glycosylase/8-oxoguanine DNA glycosylase
MHGFLDPRFPGFAPPGRLFNRRMAGPSPRQAKPLNGALAFDPEPALLHLQRVDRPLGRLIRRVGPFRLRVSKMRSTMEALAQAITYQQLHAKAAEAIFARVKRISGGGRFPSAQQILNAPDSLLRGAGLSRAKAAALKDLAAKRLDGTLPTQREMLGMEDREIVDRLTQIRGIGQWTAEMLLIFRLGRPDVLPVQDYGIRKGFALAFGRGSVTPAQVEARGERWRPYRTVASWYLWRALELPPGALSPRRRRRVQSRATPEAV